MSIRLLFFEKLHFPQVDLRILFFLLFFPRVEPKQTVTHVHVRHFAARNQCNGPDLLENTMVKLRSVYVRWLVDFDPRPLSVSLRLICGLYASRYFDYKRQWKTQSWTVGKGKQIRLNTKDKNKQQVDFVHKPNQHVIIKSRSNLTIGLFNHFMNGLLNQLTKSFFH